MMGFSGGGGGGIGVTITNTPIASQVLETTSTTQAAWTTPPGGPPSGSAGGDLTGTYPNPGVGLIGGLATSGSYARGNGTAVVLSSIQAGDVPTLNQSTTGNAANVTGTVAIGNGGTGQVTQQAAINALAGAVTSGTYLRGNGTNDLMAAIVAADLPTGTTSTKGALQLDGTAANIQSLGTQTAGANGLAADSGHIHPDEPFYVPNDLGLIAWNFDPYLVSAGFLVTGGTVYLLGIRLRVTKTVTNVGLIVTAAGATLTANENFAGLYNSSGTLLSATADQSSNWTSTGNKTIALTTQQTNLSAGQYWVAIVTNGTTQPTFGRQGGGFSGTAPEFGLSASAFRWATNSTGQTSLPASITPSSNAALSSMIWAGVS